MDPLSAIGVVYSDAIGHVVSKQTVYNRIHENPSFKESFDIATTAAQTFLESLTLNNARTAKCNGTQIQYQMSKIFREDYEDSSQIRNGTELANCRKDCKRYAIIWHI